MRFRLLHFNLDCNILLESSLVMKICVFIHIYYIEMLDELLSYISNLSLIDDLEYDLVVTLTAHNEDIEQKLYAFKDNTHILIVPNRGYDIAPFLHATKSVNLLRYDYIIKLHTKRDLVQTSYLPFCKFNGNEWRLKLLEFMNSRENLLSTFKQFELDPLVGMITSPELVISSVKQDTVADNKAEKIMKGMGLTLRDKNFVAGTMFIAKASLFKIWNHLPYNAFDFDEYNPNHKGGSLAHALERVLGFMIGAQGYKIVPYYKVGLGYKLKKLWYCFKNFIFYKRINSKGKLHIKICKIPVYSKQL